MKDDTPLNIVWQPQPGAQEEFLSCPIFEVLLHGGRGSGKALLYSSEVSTPMGFSKISNLKIGSKIHNPDGSIQKVIGIFPQPISKIYKITTTDNGIVYACQDHLWVYKRTKEDTCKYRIATTTQLHDLIKKDNSNILLPLSKPVEYLIYSKSSYKIEPYVLGCLLGDDALTQEVKEELKQLNIFGKKADKKFIPDKYKKAPIKLRWELLQGLMDTCGYCDTKGHLEYSTISRQLAYDIREVILSLGGNCVISEKKQGQLTYIVYIRFPDNSRAFSLPRKKEKCKKYNSGVSELQRQIKSIEYSHNEECVCIQVDHPNGLFLTNDYVVTHNSDVFLMDYLKNVGKGFGPAWKGIIFRETYPNLQEIKDKSKKWFRQIFPDAIFNESEYYWKFKEGEQLFFRHARRPEDYWNYHGWEIPWIGWEELTNWSNPKLYVSMMSICRSSFPGIPKRFCSTTNPKGVGHSWIKKRFKIDIVESCQVIEEATYIEELDKTILRDRCHIALPREENKILLNANPEYIINLKQQTDPNTRKAWIEGSWNIVSGGMFDDLWDRKVHILPRIHIPPTWYIDRSFDYGSSHPFSVGWWAQTDGAPIDIEYEIKTTKGTIKKTCQKTFPKGTLIRFWEWFGADKAEDNKGLRMPSIEIGEGIRKIENRIKELFKIETINPGPADSSIFDADHNNESIAANINIGFSGNKNYDIFVKADKSPGSRKKRWKLIRDRLAYSLAFPMEHPGLFVTKDCTDFIELFPFTIRDEKDLDDIDSNQNDHIQDETGYRILHNPSITGKIKYTI